MKTTVQKNSDPKWSEKFYEISFIREKDNKKATVHLTSEELHNLAMQILECEHVIFIGKYNNPQTKEEAK